jgi:hypothetical protein
MKRFTNLASILALSMVVLILPAVASAQWRNGNGNGNGNGNNDDYYRNGSYNRNLRGTIQNLKNRARNFERRLDRVDDRNNNTGWGNNNNRRYDSLEQLADRFARATNDLANEYGNGRDLNGSRNEARRVLDIGSQIDNILYRSRSGNRQVANEWDKISYDLRVLADTYGLNYRNGNQNGSGNWRNRVPFPLPF